MKLVRLLVLAAIFATALTPLAVAPSLWFPFITAKAIWFRVAVDLALLGWLAMAIRPPTVPEGTSRLRLVLRLDLPAGSLQGLIAALGPPGELPCR